MFNQIGGLNSVGGPLSDNQIGGEDFIRHIGNDKLIFDFHEGSGTKVYDKSHNNNNGTFGATTAAPTWRKNSLYFDGGDKVVLTGISHGITTGGFTFCVDLDGITDDDTLYDQTTNRLIFRNKDTGNIGIYNTGWLLISDTGISAISPLRIQVTRDNAGNLECYINGRIQSKGQSLSADLTYDGASIVNMGTNIVDSSMLTATMYSFRILNKGLSGIECQQIYLSNKWRGNN